MIAADPGAGISVEDLERRAAGSWRARETARIGDWLLRAAGGFTSRANSALAVGDPGRPLAQAVDAVCSWYGERGQPAMVAVPYPMAGPAGSAVDRLLAGLGWSGPAGAAFVMTASPETIAARLDRAAPTVSMAPAPDEAWLGRYHYRGRVLPPVARQVLVSAPWQAFASIRSGGETIAIGRVAASDGWAGLTAIEVDDRFRRRGLGTAVTAALAGLAAEQGVAGLYLQVETGNAVAHRLYAEMGFRDHHRYHYRVAPAE
jgi:ribosomal protein S18 acetylase RimI-like enzyme